MAVVNLTATNRPSGSIASQSLAGVVVEQFATVTTNADDSDTSTYTMFTKVPLSARLMHGTIVHNDDLGTSTAPDLDVGLFPEDSQFTADDDALASALAGETAGEKAVPADHKDAGKQLWEYINGVTENPGGFATIKITVDTADIDAAGDISMLLRLMHE